MEGQGTRPVAPSQRYSSQTGAEAPELLVNLGSAHLLPFSRSACFATRCGASTSAAPCAHRMPACWALTRPTSHPAHPAAAAPQKQCWTPGAPSNCGTDLRLCSCSEGKCHSQFEDILAGLCQASSSPALVQALGWAPVAVGGRRRGRARQCSVHACCAALHWGRMRQHVPATKTNRCWHSPRAPQRNFGGPNPLVLLDPYGIPLRTLEGYAEVGLWAQPYPAYAVLANNFGDVEESVRGFRYTDAAGVERTFLLGWDIVVKPRETEKYLTTVTYWIQVRPRCARLLASCMLWPPCCASSAALRGMPAPEGWTGAALSLRPALPDAPPALRQTADQVPCGFACLSASAAPSQGPSCPGPSPIFFPNGNPSVNPLDIYPGITAFAVETTQGSGEYNIYAHNEGSLSPTVSWVRHARSRISAFSSPPRLAP